MSSEEFYEFSKCSKVKDFIFLGPVYTYAQILCVLLNLQIHFLRNTINDIWNKTADIVFLNSLI